MTPFRGVGRMRARSWDSGLYAEEVSRNLHGCGSPREGLRAPAVGPANGGLWQTSGASAPTAVIGQLLLPEPSLSRRSCHYQYGLARLGRLLLRNTECLPRDCNEPQVSGHTKQPGQSLPSSEPQWLTPPEANCQVMWKSMRPSSAGLPLENPAGHLAGSMLWSSPWSHAPQEWAG